VHASPDLSQAQGKSILRFLGGILGSGVVKRNGEEITRPTYDFDAFFHKPVGVTSSGGIRLSAPALRSAFGRRDVQRFIDDGHLPSISDFQRRRCLPRATGFASPANGGVRRHCDPIGALRTRRLS
jgi:hypothetical protein